MYKELLVFVKGLKKQGLSIEDAPYTPFTPAQENTKIVKAIRAIESASGVAYSHPAPNKGIKHV